MADYWEKDPLMLNRRVCRTAAYAALVVACSSALIAKAEDAGKDFPISWRQFQQMTGPEGRGARYIRDASGGLRRIEARYGGGLLVAVTEEKDGFRLTIGQDLALSDIATRGWFHGAESDALFTVYEKFQQTGNAEMTAGRFHFKAERDPNFRIKPSILITMAR